MKIFRMIRRKRNNGEHGQAMLLIALAFIGLVAFIGLAIDAGILFAHIGHLRRGVDAAALSAANQIRQSYETPAKRIEAATTAAEELILLNLPAGSPGELKVVVETCESEPTTIPNCIIGGVKRKLARVEAALDVNLAFLPMVGWDHVEIKADAISEAASIDLVLVIDNSTSMAYDYSCTNGKDDDNDGQIDDCRDENHPTDPQYPWPGESLPFPQNPVPCTLMFDETDPCMDGGTEFDLPEDYFRYPSVCNYYGNCQPFEDVRAAAYKLIEGMFVGYDKISIVTFNKFAGLVNNPDFRGTDAEIPLHVADLQLTTDTVAAANALADMTVYPNMNIVADSACEDWEVWGDPRGCMRTNHAAGLMLAGMEFESLRAREEAVKVVVLLSDGLANSAYAPDPGFGVPDFTNPNVWYCPNEYRREPLATAVPGSDGRTRVIDDHIKPFCTDGNPALGYNGVSNVTVFDADDAARKMADWLGCLPLSEGGNCAFGGGPTGTGGLGAVIFTIGLGDGVVRYSPAPSGIVGEELLRYIARVGYNGEPEYNSKSPCWEVASETSCGNYYFTRNPDDLDDIFKEIADRIFTRLTH